MELSRVLRLALLALVVVGLSSTTPAAAQIDVNKLGGALDTVYHGDEQSEGNSNVVPSAVVGKTFSFLGNGFLGIYAIGVAEKLTQLGALKRNSPINAASSGALFSGSYCAGAKFSDIYKALRSVIGYCSPSQLYCLGKVDSLLAKQLTKIVPDTKKKKPYPNCKNLIVSLSKSTGLCNILSSPTNYGIEGSAIFASNFKSKKDLLSVIRGSGFIPGLSSFSCYLSVRGEKVIDGGFVANSFCPGGDCVKIYGFPPTANRSVDIYPGIRPGSLVNWPFNATVWADVSFRPDLIYPNFDTIVQFGRDDGEYWFNQQNV